MLLAVCQELEMETENDVIPRIAGAFAGGIGNTGSVCGAVVGAVMAIGLKQGRAQSVEEKLGNLAVAQEFRRRFEAEMKTISCRELTGLDLTTEEGLHQLMNSNIAQKACFSAVAAAYRLVLELLADILVDRQSESRVQEGGLCETERTGRAGCSDCVGRSECPEFGGHDPCAS